MRRIICTALIAGLVSTGIANARSGSGAEGAGGAAGSGAGEGNGRTYINIHTPGQLKLVDATPDKAETELLILITPRLRTPREPKTDDSRFTR
ncbi:MAG: hypothetical protein AB3N20_15495 [Rhizobiaceae bacterium]